MAGQHCEFAPSAFERIAACPAAVQRSRGIGEGPSSPYAEEGTHAHLVAAEELSKALGWETDPSKGLARPEVTDELREAVELYVEAVMSVVDPRQDYVWVEQRVDLSTFNPPAPLWGTSDAMVFKPITGQLFVFDFKYGKGISVEV